MQRKPKTFQATRVAIEWLSRGLKDATVAKQFGVTIGTLRVQRAASFPSTPLRHKIEALFNYEVELWCPRPILALRKRCVENIGADPFTCDRDQLRALVQKLGITAARGKACDAIASFVAANPKFILPKDPKVPPPS